MKHIIIEIIYRIPAEQIGEVVAEHRAFLRGATSVAGCSSLDRKLPRPAG